MLNFVQVRTWSEVYSSVIEDTKGYVEKKQASTYEELVAEQELKAEEVTLQTCCAYHLPERGCFATSGNAGYSVLGVAGDDACCGCAGCSSLGQ